MEVYTEGNKTRILQLVIYGDDIKNIDSKNITNRHSKGVLVHGELAPK